jgi:hypothetical protein
MASALRHFSIAGIAEFSKWLRAGAKGQVPVDLLTESEFSKPLIETELLNRRHFENRFDFGCHLVQLLQPFRSREISFNRGLWAWLAAWHFEELCPLTPDGVRKLREENTYIPSESRIYYRHLVRTPWYLVSTHGDACQFLLVSPLNQQSYLLDQLAARQFVIASPTLIAAAKRLYTNPRTGQPRLGAGAKGAGSPRRLALIANQLLLTYDIRAMPVDKFMNLLPEEFQRRFNV